MDGIKRQESDNKKRKSSRISEKNDRHNWMSKSQVEDLCVWPSCWEIPHHSSSHYRGLLEGRKNCCWTYTAKSHHHWTNTPKGGTFWACTRLHWCRAAAAGDSGWSRGLCMVRCNSQSKPWLPLSKAGKLPETLTQNHKRYLQFVTPIKWHSPSKLSFIGKVFLLGRTLNTDAVSLTERCVIKKILPFHPHLSKLLQPVCFCSSWQRREKVLKK